MNQELRELLEDCNRYISAVACEGCPYKGDYCGVCYMGILVKIHHQLETNGWRSVINDPPNEDEILLYIKDYGIQTGTCFENDICTDYVVRQAYEGDYWQPLPEPPKGEE